MTLPPPPESRAPAAHEDLQRWARQEGKSPTMAEDLATRFRPPPSRFKWRDAALVALWVLGVAWASRGCGPESGRPADAYSSTSVTTAVTGK